MNTKEKILVTAEKLIVENGVEQVNLTDIATAVGISQPALYKHFKNKNDIFSTLAFNWLNQILSDIFPFKTAKSDLAECCHDWLWTLASSKYRAYQDTPEMFALYTTYLGSQPELEQQHIKDLLASFSAASQIKNERQLGAFLYLFSRFHHPYFASEWNEHFQQDFESCWKVVKPYFDNKK